MINYKDWRSEQRKADVPSLQNNGLALSPKLSAVILKKSYLVFCFISVDVFFCSVEKNDKRDTVRPE
jgi:hypothetical protein